MTKFFFNVFRFNADFPIILILRFGLAFYEIFNSKLWIIIKPETNCSYLNEITENASFVHSLIAIVINLTGAESGCFTEMIGTQL